MAKKKQKPIRHKRKSGRNPPPADNDNDNGNGAPEKPKPAAIFNSTFIRFPDKVTDEASGRTVLIEAILGSDAEKIAKLLSSGASPNKATKDGKTPLHYAAKLGNFEALNLLLEAGAQINPRDKALATPLFDAISCPQPLNMIDALLDAGADADIPDAEGRIPLHVAAENAPVPIIRQLIEATGNPNRPDARGYQPLHRACEKNTVDAVQAILFERVAVFSSVLDGDTCLHIAAARQDSTTVADYLLTTEAAQLVNAVNLNGRSPLHLAVIHKHPELVGKMLEAGAHVNLPDAKGFTALHEAAEAGDAKMARLLIEGGADVAKSQQLHRATPLIIAIKANAKEVVDLLLSHAADPSADDADGMTPLMAAASRGSEEIVNALLGAGADARATDRLGRNVLQHCTSTLPEAAMGKLIDAGADINNRDTWKRSPLISAIMDRNAAMARKLLEKGADPNVKDDSGASALVVALNCRMLDVLGSLLDKGADPNVRERWSNQSALALCCTLGLESEVGKLIKAGADLSAKDNQGRTPLHAAVQNSYSSAETVKQLLAAGADPLVTDSAGHSAYDMAYSLDKQRALQEIQQHLKTKGIDAKPTRYNPWGGGWAGGF